MSSFTSSRYYLKYMLSLCYHTFYTKDTDSGQSLGARSVLVSLLTPPRHLALCLAMILNESIQEEWPGCQVLENEGTKGDLTPLFLLKKKRLKIQEMFLRWAWAEQRKIEPRSRFGGKK